MLISNNSSNNLLISIIIRESNFLQINGECQVLAFLRKQTFISKYNIRYNSINIILK